MNSWIFMGSSTAILGQALFAALSGSLSTFSASAGFDFSAVRPISGPMATSVILTSLPEEELP